MSLQQQSPSKKPELSAPVLPWMLRPCASQLSREQRSPMSKPSKKPRPPTPAPSGRLKPLALWPIGMLRPMGPLRLSHSTGNMAKQSNTWRNKSSKRKAEAKLTSSPPVRLPYNPSSRAQRCAAGFLSHFVGACTMSYPFTLPQGTSPAEQQSAPAAPPVPVPRQPLGPKGGILLQTMWTACLWVEPHPRQPWKVPPSSIVRCPTLEQSAQAEPLRSIQLGHWLGEGG